MLYFSITRVVGNTENNRNFMANGNNSEAYVVYF